MRHNRLKEELPIGLAFAFLKGTLSHLNDTLYSYDTETVWQARIALNSSLEGYQSAFKKCPESYVKEQLRNIGEELIEDSSYMLNIASSWLSSKVKLV